METAVNVIFLIGGLLVLALLVGATHRFMFQLTAAWHEAQTWYIMTGQDRLIRPKPRYVRYIDRWLDRAEKNK